MWLAFFAGLFIGANIGVLIAALCFAAGRRDRGGFEDVEFPEEK